MIQKVNKPTFLRKLYPNTKLWVSLALVLVVMLVQNYWISGAIMVVSVVWTVHEKYVTEFKVILFAILLMFVMMFSINGMLNPVCDKTKDPFFILPLLNWKFYKEGIDYAMVYFMRIAPLMASLFLLFRTINMTDLGVAMCEAGLSYHASFIFVSTFQIIPVLGKDMNQIMDAQRARGLDTDGNIWKRFKAFIPVMVPVVANSIMKVRDRAVAMESKGFNAECGKTIYRDLEKSKADAALKIISIVVSAGCVLYWILVRFVLK